jgi:hypothetical protein
MEGRQSAYAVTTRAASDATPRFGFPMRQRNKRPRAKYSDTHQTFDQALYPRPATTSTVRVIIAAAPPLSTVTAAIETRASCDSMWTS